MYPKVSIIILNWNGWRDTIECLESVYQINYPNYEVIVVDNGSTDDSIEKIKEYCEGKIKVESKFFKYNPNNKPIYVLKYTKDEAKKGNFRKEKYFSKLPSNKKLRIILNEKNYGFAEGNNIGIKYAIKVLNAEYVLLLNNDTVVDKNFLTELVKIAESNKDVGSVQSLLLKPCGNVIDSLGQELLNWEARDIGMGSDIKLYDIRDSEIFGACAASALYRSRVLEEVGLFDRTFFVIYEDVDLSWRLRINGYISILASKSIVYHKRGISGSIQHKCYKYTQLKKYHGSKNLLFIIIRYYPKYIILKYFWKFLYLLTISTYYSIKSNRNLSYINCLLKNLKIREEYNQNRIIHKLQKKWIKKR